MVLLGEVTQRVDKHEFGHDLGQGVLAHHLGISVVHGIVIVGQVIGIGGLIHGLLVLVHVLEILNVVGILHGLSVLGVGKLGEDAVAVGLGISDLPVAHVHHVHVIEHVESIGVVGIALEQLVELIGRRIVVFHLVLEDDTHVVEALLDNLMSRLDFLFGLGYLLEVILLEVGILGTLERFEVDLDAVAILVDRHAVGHGKQGAIGLLIVEREGHLVVAAPVVLEFAAAP